MKRRSGMELRNNRKPVEKDKAFDYTDNNEDNYYEPIKKRLDKDDLSYNEENEDESSSIYSSSDEDGEYNSKTIPSQSSQSFPSSIYDLEDEDSRDEIYKVMNIVKKKKDDRKMNLRKKWLDINEWTLNSDYSYTRKLGDTYFKVFEYEEKWFYNYQKDHTIKIFYQSMEDLLKQTYYMFIKDIACYI
jgi:hypothetical protein